ncbi:hypothetical protein JANAI62_13670 [Jannaschia pagri]|uniref:Uncharacterized protein n=1 Tax=Jannaschia pagri TaxID=2829797 RepID=A0ABQ4NK24_9RHOB|nr:MULTISPECIES: hypothetical protein [unclassified Jannaschia]GIT90913.1 hypothetical protein JANAI61_13710 [Jannaschia sp. AI_61]GIT94744.1 hypothetical protein JANAI62_13670 [Jannaschia sp. AI_62]
MLMIPRALVAEALGLPEGTDALPPGDLPMDRFLARYMAYLGTVDASTETPDAWTGALMDSLIAHHPDLALSALRSGAALDGADVLIDPLLDLSAAPNMAAAIAEAADMDEAFAVLVARAQDTDAD